MFAAKPGGRQQGVPLVSGETKNIGGFARLMLFCEYDGGSFQQIQELNSNTEMFCEYSFDLSAAEEGFALYV